MPWPAKAALGVVGFFALIAAGIVFVFATGTASIVTAPFRGQVAQVEAVQADPDYRIAAYDSFYSLCASVQVKEDSIEIMQAELDALPAGEGRRELLQAAITAQRNTRAQLIRDYNADAAKTDTRGNFLASDLPYALDPDQENTTC